MLLLALAIAPGIAICLYLLYKDVYNREPGKNMIFSFILGMLVIIPAAILEIILFKQLPENIYATIFSAYFIVAFLEELGKYLVLRYYSYKKASFDEPLDGIVYSVMISMGFATIENIGYVMQHGIAVAFLRMFTSVPAHASFAVIMGYYVGKAKFDWNNRHKYLVYGLIGAMFFHGTYDVFLFLSEVKIVTRYISELLLFAGAIASLVIGVRLSRKLLRIHHTTSNNLFRAPAVLTIRNASEADIDLIRNLTMQVWPQTYSSILPKPQIKYMLNYLYSRTSLEKQFKERHQFIIIYNAGIPVGFASFSEIGKQLFKLHKLYILPVHQGRGTGKFVIEQIINDIRTRGATALQLNVNRYNKAKTFYEKLGFNELRSEDIDIGNGYFMNDYVMELRLN